MTLLWKRRNYFLRCLIFARIRRFLRPIFRRPFPDFFVPKIFVPRTDLSYSEKLLQLLSYYHAADRTIKEPAADSSESIPVGDCYFTRLDCG